MIRVIIADDQALIRAAVGDLLSASPDVEVVAQARNGKEARDLALEHRPDVVLMDIRMPEVDGIAATSLICADPKLDATRILILTTFEDDEYVVAALRAGASGFIGKGSEPEDIVTAVRAIHQGDALLSSAATRGLIGKYFAAGQERATRDQSPIEHLTEREREVLELVGKGMPNDELATHLFISPHTAKTHVKRIMMKLGSHDRAQLVIVAYETGLVTPGG